MRRSRPAPRPVVRLVCFHDIVRKLGGLPPDVRRVEFHFGEDSEGTPAVWITFVAGDDLKPSKQKIADLQKGCKRMQGGNPAQ